MLSRHCIVIPVFNHPQGIQEVCHALSNYAIPCVLVDDGCNQECHEVLAVLAGANSWIELLSFPVNRGKGAAVSAGMEWAYQRDFTHILQVDADGQHDLGDIHRFIEASEKMPDTIVTGSRIAEGISAARHYGRKLTDWLVWLETLSTQIEDSMCGYRVYPLRPTIELLRDRKIGQRMDFDTDILVRLCWRGIPVEQISTRVIYHDQIPSHFRMFRDNLRVTKMHIMLILGMLLRFPVLIGRKFSTE